jgi:hypothetical protein
MNTPVGPILRESRGLDRSVPRSAALVLGTDVRFPEKNWPAKIFTGFFIGAVQQACAVAMRENIGSVGAMRERDRIDLGSTTERHLDFYFVIF